MAIRDDCDRCSKEGHCFKETLHRITIECLLEEYQGEEVIYLKCEDLDPITNKEDT